MAILSKEINQVEVRIRRHPENTYFDEYVKVGDREKTDATSCDRYIIPELGKTYAIEVTLRKGYNFGQCKRVRVALYLEGTSQQISRMCFYRPDNYVNFLEEDLSIYLCYARKVWVDGRVLSGSRLVFRDIAIDEELDDETNLKGVSPRILGSFKVEVVKQHYTPVDMTLEEQEESIEDQRRKILESRGRRLWDANKVDQGSFKKHGITAAIGFVGGYPSEPKRKRYWLRDITHGVPLEFRFHCRPAEYFEQVNIVPYPPPLHSFSWEHLDEDERRIALKKLQETEINRTKGYEYVRDPMNEPEEWRPWNVMEPWERRVAFRKLQQARKAYQRGEVQNQITEIPATRIIDLESNRSGSESNSLSRSSPVLILDSPPRANITRKRPAESQLQGQSRRGTEIKKEVIPKRPQAPARSSIKQEPIDVDALNDSEVQMLPASTLKYDPIRRDIHTAKRVKFEEDTPVDLSMYEDYEVEQPDTIEEQTVSEEERREVEERQAEMERLHEEGIQREERVIAEIRRKARALL